ncbi:hypothetical protein C7Y71_007890 [Pseudoprevotella muciniphila]|uniref:Uncharacterized protein n=1 Tax=Pseudoprevotella muciniphila TaxID=2133944 RepID=A0A5P8E7M1_9BACT|nr:hypothetical protein C7Y71_007890 [Pseudoprevotella muciniphila]
MNFVPASKRTESLGSPGLRGLMRHSFPVAICQTIFACALLGMEKNAASNNKVKIFFIFLLF